MSCIIQLEHTENCWDKIYNINSLGIIFTHKHNPTHWIGALDHVFVLFKDQLHFSIAQSTILGENNNVKDEPRTV